jgi:hypothetical protein
MASRPGRAKRLWSLVPRSGVTPHTLLTYSVQDVIPEYICCTLMQNYDIRREGHDVAKSRGGRNTQHQIDSRTCERQLACCSKIN